MATPPQSEEIYPYVKSLKKPPKCPHCLGERVFEFQMLSSVIDLVADGIRKSAVDATEQKLLFLLGKIDWSTVMIYSCEKIVFDRKLVAQVETTAGNLGE